MRKIKKLTVNILLALIIALFFSIHNYAQTGEKKDFFFLQKGDTIALVLKQPLKSFEQYNVFRKKEGVKDNSYVKLNSEPISLPLHSEILKISAGQNWNKVLEALKTDDDEEAFRILKSGGFSSSIISLLFPEIAKELGRIYFDASASKKITYRYKITFYDFKGKAIDSIEKKTPTTFALPAPPANLEVKTGDRKITLRWKYPKWNNANDDLVLQFYVFRKNQKGSYEKINDIIILRDDSQDFYEFEDLWLDNSVVYNYYVVAVDPLQNFSKTSNIVSAAPKDLTPPSPPRNLSAKEGDGIIELIWDYSLDIDVKYYNIFRSTGIDKKYEKINKIQLKPNEIYYKDSAIVTGQQYFYYVVAIDEAGNISEKSNIVNAIAKDMTPPKPPKNIKTKEIKGKNIEITWDKSPSKDAVGYNVYRGENEKVLSRLNDTPVNAFIFIDKGYKGEGLVAGKKYIIAASAVDKSNNESDKIFAEIRIIDNEPPLPPSNFFAKNYDGRYVEIYCGASLSLDVARYEVYRFDYIKENINLSKKIYEFNKAPFNLRDTTVKKGMKVAYFAVAIDSFNNISGKSIIDSVFVRDYSLPPKTRNVYLQKKNNGIYLKWERVVDFDFIGFNVYRSNLPTGIYQKINKNILTIAEFFDPEGKDYHYYKIGSLDSSGNENLSEAYVFKKK